MTKELLLLALLLLLLYSHHQQQGKGINLHQKGPTIPQLQQEIKDWETRYTELETSNNQQAQTQQKEVREIKATQQTYLKKIDDLETSLLNLAKQKIKGKKEVRELLKQLENNWQSDKDNWEKEKVQLEQDFKTKRAESKKHWIAKEKEWQKGKQELTQQLETKNQTFNEQLRKINLLFDPQAGSYETIDFNGLYSLLSKNEELELRKREKILKAKLALEKKWFDLCNIQILKKDFWRIRKEFLAWLEEDKSRAKGLENWNSFLGELHSVWDREDQWEKWGKHVEIYNSHLLSQFTNYMEGLKK